jgi:general secretion pathway protein M
VKEWFTGLAPRERAMVSIAAVVVVLALVYAVAWGPLASSVNRLQQSVEEQQALKQWMQQSAAEVNQLRGAAGASDDHRSLLAVVDQTSKQSQLGPAVKRIEPDGQELVRVSLEQASFDDMVTWLGSLQRSYGVSVADVSIDRQADSGRVNARITLKRSGP